MIVLVLGRPDSGKSKIAEDIVMRLAEGLDPDAARSGASDHAGAVSPAASSGMDKLYIATMIPFGEEGIRRIEKHRKMRAGKGFLTVEKYKEVDSLIGEIRDLGGKCCLLECMSNLVGNEMHASSKDDAVPPMRGSDSDGNGMQADTASGRFIGSDPLYAERFADRIANEIKVLADSVHNLIIVTNEYNDSCRDYDDETRLYVKLLNMVNDRIIAYADHVYDLRKGRVLRKGETVEDYKVDCGCVCHIQQDPDAAV